MRITRKPCPCCGEFVGDPDFYDKLDMAQDRLDRPLVVTSGYRCPAHNAKISPNTTGRHPKGQAVDVQAKTAAEKGEILLACMRAGLVSFATLPNRAGLHIDAGTAPWLGIE